MPRSRPPTAPDRFVHYILEEMDTMLHEDGDPSKTEEALVELSHKSASSEGKVMLIGLGNTINGSAVARMGFLFGEFTHIAVPPHEAPDLLKLMSGREQANSISQQGLEHIAKSGVKGDARAALEKLGLVVGSWRKENTMEEHR